MGLDMYLSKKTYVKYWEHNGDNNYEVTVTKAGNPTKINPKKVSYIVEEVGYWRKANQIHNWFVENVQNGIDECQESYVSREQLQSLLDICRIVKIDKDKAPQLLSTQSGFFFGGTEYDEWYFNDIDNTIQIIEEALSDENADDFAYRASW
jgi:hypothetical protein